MLKIKWFSKGNSYKGGWELNIMTSTYQLRIAQYQFALWKNYNAIFNLLNFA